MNPLKLTFMLKVISSTDTFEVQNPVQFCSFHDELNVNNRKSPVGSRII